MIAIVETIIRTRIINTTDVQIHRKRVVNGNVLIVTNMSASLSLEQHIVRKNKGAVIMTIDEAISEFKERAEDSKKISELGMKSYIPKEKEEKQLVEWLKELKSYRASVFSGDMTQKMLKEEYCKAVDDFAESVKNLIVDLSVIKFKDIDEIAEQLKRGDSE